VNASLKTKALLERKKDKILEQEFVLFASSIINVLRVPVGKNGIMEKYKKKEKIPLVTPCSWKA
jgi:hypothetical protein